MDVVLAVSGYVSKMVSFGDGASGTPSAKMKILLLDSETVRAYLIETWVSVVCN
jgi:vacuolar protein sorting-associated protein 45